MLTIDEKNKVKDVIQYGLGIRRDINLAYFLKAIEETNDDVKNLKSQIDRIIYNQRILDDKLDKIIRMLMSEKR